MQNQPMTLEEMILYLGQYNRYLLIYLAALPVSAFLYSRIHTKGRGESAPHRYVYAVLIYLAAVPGIMGCVLTGYSLFFVSTNLLQVRNPVLYFVPIISMVVTLILISKRVDLNQVPGFDRLYGLLVLLGVTFILALIIMKTRIWLVFGGSIAVLIAVVTFLFLLLKWGAGALFRGKDEPKLKRPRFPEI